MLNIRITRLDDQEGGIQITGGISQPRFYAEDPLTPEDQKALEFHQKRQLEYLNLHLGDASLIQARVE